MSFSSPSVSCSAPGARGTASTAWCGKHAREEVAGVAQALHADAHRVAAPRVAPVELARALVDRGAHAVASSELPREAPRASRARAASERHGSPCSQRSARNCASWNAAESATGAPRWRARARSAGARATSAASASRVGQRLAEHVPVARRAEGPHHALERQLDGLRAARRAAACRKARSAERRRRTPTRS